MSCHLLKDDNGKTIDVAVGDTFTIDLPGNPTTGYIWMREGITTEDQSDAKFSVKREFKRNAAPKGMVGVGGTEHFQVTARSHGVHEFVLVHKRSWMKADSSNEKYTVNVRVNKVEMDRFGDFVVLAYHDVQDASSLHGQFKQRSIDAAVIDSAYILSRLHLAVALHRIAPQLFSLDSAEAQPPPATSRQRARDVFLALSLTRNLDRVLQRLTCAEKTQAIVIVLPSPPVEHIAAVRDIVRGTPHDLHSLSEYCDVVVVADFYGLASCDTAALEASVVNRLATNDI